MLNYRQHHVAHLALVFWGHHNDVRHSPKIGDVEQAVMSWAIATGYAPTVETELDVQILDADIVDYLVKRALQERGINGTDRLQPFTRHSGRKRHAMLFGNSHIERSFRKPLQRIADTSAIGHGGS